MPDAATVDSRHATRGWPRPFEESYGIALGTAILSLVPYIILTSAVPLYREQVVRDLGTTATGLEIVNGLGTAAYAFGALLAGDLINRFRQRALFLLAEALFILGCATCAIAGDIAAYGAGRVLQGLMTGLLLIIALPPVIRRFPAERMPITAGAVNIGFFGAVTVGPLLGGLVAFGQAWRWFDAGLGAAGCVTLVLASLALPRQEPPDRGMPFDAAGIALGLGATVLPFWAVGELTEHGFASPLFIAPLASGLLCFVALLLLEYHKAEPLSPVKQMWHTFPLIGTLVAMVAGAAFVTFVELGQQFLLHVAHRSPSRPALPSGRRCQACSSPPPHSACCCARGFSRSSFSPACSC